MNLKINKSVTGKFVLLFVLFGAGIAACKKDIPDDNLVVVKEFSAYRSSTEGTASAVRFRDTAIINTTIDSAGIPLLLDAATQSDEQVSAQVDTSLVAVYNSVYQTSFPSLPQGAFAVSGNGAVTVKAGELQSSDSLYVKLKNASRLLDTAVYLIPVRLMAPSGVQLKSSVVFLKMKVSIAGIYASISSFSNFNNAPLMYMNQSWVREYTDLRINGVDNGPSVIGVQTKLGTPVPFTVLCYGQADAGDSLVNAYNIANYASYKPMPANIFSLVKDSDSIPAGSYYSADSFQIHIGNLSTLATGSTYILGVKLIDKGDNKSAPPANTNARYGYITITTTSINTGNVIYPAAAISGTVSDRTGWSVTGTAAGTYYSHFPSDVLDGDNTTFWNSIGVLPTGLILDMGTAHTMKGFRITPQYVFSNDFINTDVYSGNDGINWTLQGTYIGIANAAGTSAVNPDIKTIGFVKPVTARYFKFNVTKSTGIYSAAMAEINGVE